MYVCIYIYIYIYVHAYVHECVCVFQRFLKKIGEVTGVMLY